MREFHVLGIILDKKMLDGCINRKSGLSANTDRPRYLNAVSYENMRDIHVLIVERDASIVKPDSISEQSDVFGI
jgi:hypothetical protein